MPNTSDVKKSFNDEPTYKDQLGHNCEGSVAYRLLESLKLYLNAKNCVYVLGLDQEHLEEAVARVLSGSDKTRSYRPLARDYLGKMFQNRFLLPVPKKIPEYLGALLNPHDTELQRLLEERFGLETGEWPDAVIAVLDENLPHNPRKVKAFLSSWKLYVNLLAKQHNNPLNWRLTIALNYLGQFEEPMFRKVEEAPGWFIDEVVSFCRTGKNADHLLFEGLELPYKARGKEAEKTGELVPLSTATDTKQRPAPRIFWVSRLVSTIDEPRIEDVQRHLLGTESGVARTST